ncbi:MAG: HD domain-containing protein [Actinobacteria bacterium]|nr:HD domain-containing protein [Actinomycetota bacterium]
MSVEDTSAHRLRPLHRAERFLGSLLASAPSPDDERWAEQFLDEREITAFRKMSAADRRHAIGVTRAVARNLERVDLSEDDPGARWILAAGLLHDVGKSVAGLGTYGRSVATLSGWIGGHDMAASWADTRGFTRKVGLYLQYPELGADVLRMAGSDDRVVAWAAEHHEPEESWTIPIEVGRLLQLADDGRL